MAGLFSQRGGLVYLTGKAFTCSDVSDFQSMVMCRGTPLVMEEVFVEKPKGLLKADCSR